MAALNDGGQDGPDAVGWGAELPGGLHDLVSDAPG